MHPESNTEVPLNPGPILDMLQAHQRTSALKAAIDLDVFRAVGEGPGDVASIARHCSASERGIRILCDFLTIYGVLTKENGRYLHTPMSAAFLDPRSPASVASMAQFISNKAMLEPYEHLTDIVRTGRTVLPGDGSVEPDNPIWVQFAETMAPMMAPVADPLGALVLEGAIGADARAGYRRRTWIIRDRDRETESAGARHWTGLGSGFAGSSGERQKGGSCRSLRDAAGERVRRRVWRTLRYNPADKLPASFRSSYVRNPVEEGTRRATAGRVRSHARVRAERRPCFAADACRVRNDDAGVDSLGRCVYAERNLPAMYKEAGLGEIIRVIRIPMSPHTVVLGRALKGVIWW